MLKITSSIHNHTTFCDGKSTPEEMLQEAIRRGLTTIGFSAHSYTPCDPSYCLRDTDGYFAEIERLKGKYQDQITVLAGLEVDRYGVSDPRADYVIMSVHNVIIGDRLYVVDYSKEELEKCIKECYDGDVYRLVEDYYRTVEESLDIDGYDVVGHLDLVTKYNQMLPLIDYTDPRYVSAVDRVLQKLDGKNIPLEVNTGGVARGYKTEFYPSREVLSLTKKYDIPLCVTADAHTKEGVDFGFDSAVAMLKELGFGSVVQLTKVGFVTTQIG